LISEVARRSSAVAASSAEISFRHLNSCSTEEASDHIRYGATKVSRERGANPTSLRLAVTTVEASTTSKSAADAGGAKGWDTGDPVEEKRAILFVRIPKTDRDCLD